MSRYMTKSQAESVGAHAPQYHGLMGFDIKGSSRNVLHLNLMKPESTS